MSIELNLGFLPPDKLSQEVVERKGLGHPDTLVDGIVEQAELDYSSYCLENFGAIPHHNLDKATLIGGLCLQKYGGGKFQAPLDMIFMGRASQSFGVETIPLAEIQYTAAKKYLARVLPHLDTDDPTVYGARSLTSTHSTRPHWFTPRSIDDLPEYQGNSPRANDTATMISYWPLTASENLTLSLEGYFYKDNAQGLPEPRFDHFGQDIKVMTVRNGDTITATLAVPQITTETPTKEIYFERERELEKALQAYALEIVGDEAKINIILNTQTKGPSPRPYLVTAGSCTDFGEEGAVGRGNKTHGIISSFRPNTMEAPHGKNPTYFVGKILGYQADIISRNIFVQTGSRCQVVMQANIGDDLFDPARIVVSTESNVDYDTINDIVAKSLSLGRDTTQRIIDEAHFLPGTKSWSDNATT